MPFTLAVPVAAPAFACDCGPPGANSGLGPLDLGAPTAPGVTELVLVAMVALPAVMRLVFAMPLSVAPADSQTMPHLAQRGPSEGTAPFLAAAQTQEEAASHEEAGGPSFPPRRAQEAASASPEELPE